MCGGGGGIVPPFLTLYEPPSHVRNGGKELPGTHGWEAGWAPDSVWMLSRCITSLIPAWKQTPAVQPVEPWPLYLLARVRRKIHNNFGCFLFSPWQETGNWEFILLYIKLRLIRVFVHRSAGMYYSVFYLKLKKASRRSQSEPSSTPCWDEQTCHDKQVVWLIVCIPSHSWNILHLCWS
jgi:hypothetical protein